MKKFVSVISILAMMLVLVSCGNQVADKYCTSCGAGMAKNDEFCHACGAGVGGVAEASTTNVAAETPTDTNPSTTVASPSSDVSTTTFVTNPVVSATTTASLTEKTTTITSVSSTTAISTRTTHVHTFSKYVCTGCGKLDKEHAYEYLIELTKSKGVVNGTVISFDIFKDGTYFLQYDAYYDNLSIYSVSTDSYGRFWYSSIHLSTYFYGVGMSNNGTSECELTGYLDAATFTDNSPISYVKYKGNSDRQYSFIEAARTSLVCLVEALNCIAEQSDGLDMTIADLGFVAWE